MSGIIINDVADHFGVFYGTTSQVNVQTQDKRVYRVFSDENIEKFSSSFDSIDFSPVISAQCPNEAYSKFIELYKTKFDQSFPLKSTVAKSHYIKREPWMTPGLLVSSHNISKLLVKKLNKPTETNI